MHDIPDGMVAMVTTHLEMLLEAQARPVSLPEGIGFERITPDVATYRALYRLVGDDWLWFGRLEISDDELTAILSDPKMEFYTLTKDGQNAALLELDFRQDGECELVYFGLGKPLIGSGAGRYLMNQAIRLAWEKPITRFHVHTCTADSPQALAFYMRSGFTPFKRQIEVAPDPRLSGLTPHDVAPHVPVISG